MWIVVSPWVRTEQEPRWVARLLARFRGNEAVEHCLFSGVSLSERQGFPLLWYLTYVKLPVLVLLARAITACSLM